MNLTELSPDEFTRIFILCALYTPLHRSQKNTKLNGEADINQKPIGDFSKTWAE